MKRTNLPDLPVLCYFLITVLLSSCGGSELDSSSIKKDLSENIELSISSYESITSGKKQKHATFLLENSLDTEAIKDYIEDLQLETVVELKKSFKSHHKVLLETQKELSVAAKNDDIRPQEIINIRDSSYGENITYEDFINILFSEIVKSNLVIEEINKYLAEIIS